MSEVAKNAEIEDVLSSIRRLVAGAEAGRRATSAATRTAAPPEADAEDGAELHAADLHAAVAEAGEDAVGANAPDRGETGSEGTSRPMDAESHDKPDLPDAPEPLGMVDGQDRHGGPIPEGLDGASTVVPGAENVPEPLISGDIAESTVTDLPASDNDMTTPAAPGATAPGDETAEPDPGSLTHDALVLEPSQRVPGGEPDDGMSDASDGIGAKASDGATEPGPLEVEASATKDIGLPGRDSGLPEGRAGEPSPGLAPEAARRSPFFSPVQSAEDAPNENAASVVKHGDPQSAPARGFGFGIAPRTDPVRHVPLDQLPPAETGAAFDDAQDGRQARPIISPDFRRPPLPAPQDGEASRSDDAGPARDEADVADREAVMPQGFDHAAASVLTDHAHKEPAIPVASSEGIAPDASSHIGEPEGDDAAQTFPGESEQEVAPETAATVDPDAEHAATRRVDTAAEANENLFAAHAPLADAAMIRALVSQCVREELEGATGHRASERVRALVRAEIARALADMTPQG